ncbi:MAG: Resolvase helix-turn-helix domain protein [Planctomycetaceae bacterium]|nr:Resolvase helix-turn-helix domain protein [Planctomycetaceae bacterium]
MAPRSGRLSNLDSQGQYVRQLGWKQNANGSRVQHKFRLGADKREAERRDDRLRQLWEQICKDTPQAEALWDNLTLEIAKQIAKGDDRIVVPPNSEKEAAPAYADRLQGIQNRFAFLRFAPSDTELYAQGIGDKAVDRRDIVLTGEPFGDYWSRKSFAERFYPPPLKPQNEAESVVLKDDPIAQMLAYTPLTHPKDDGATLHQAFDAYQAWIKEHYTDDSKGTLSEYAHTKLGQIDTLKAHHDDVKLNRVDYDYIEKMYRYWAHRPLKRSPNSSGNRISHSSIRHYLGELHRFFKWLHRSKNFTWRKPEDLDDIDRTIPPNTESVKRRIRKVDTFQLEELRLLNRYATPIERLYLMLGLNCGFGTKEIATLTIGEIFLHQALPTDEQEVFGFESTNADSFVSLVRNKTTIVGKYLLFKQTAQLLEWGLAWRLKLPNPAADQPAILNSKGTRLDRRSGNGNPSRQIPNTFIRLQDRILADNNQITRLPFKYLRKTAGDLIRRFSDGEIAGVFLLHGSPVKTDKLSDVYTNRPFGKVYEAIRRVEEYLQPVFEEAGDSPILEQPQAYTSRKTIDRIADLKRSGKSIREIAEETGKSRMTIYRHIENLRKRGLLDS